MYKRAEKGLLVVTVTSVIRYAWIPPPIDAEREGCPSSSVRYGRTVEEDEIIQDVVIFQWVYNDIRVQIGRESTNWV